MRENRIRILIVSMLFLVFAGCKSKTEFYLEENDSVFSAEEAEHPQSEEQERITEQETQILAVCYVYLCGAVKNPGVYALPTGSRIFEAVAMAGGLNEEADEKSVNQAAFVTDGMMIQIATKNENGKNTEDEIVQEYDDGKININTAGITELMTLPGIGRAKAEAILAYRAEQGSFSVIEDLMKVSGIKEGIFLQVKEHIKVKND